MPILIGILIGLSALFVINEVVASSVLGWFIPAKKLDEFFEKNLVDYQDEFLKEERPARMFYGIAVGDRDLHLPFISHGPLPAISKWYIHEMGRIPRWSKWSKKLDEIWKTRN